MKISGKTNRAFYIAEFSDFVVVVVVSFVEKFKESWFYQQFSIFGNGINEINMKYFALLSFPTNYLFGLEGKVLIQGRNVSGTLTIGLPVTVWILGVKLEKGQTVPRRKKFCWVFMMSFMTHSKFKIR